MMLVAGVLGAIALLLGLLVLFLGRVSARQAKQLVSSESLAGILNDVLSYDRDALEGRLFELGWRPGRQTHRTHQMRVLVDDLDCFNGPHPGIAVMVEFKAGRIARFRADRAL